MGESYGYAHAADLAVMLPAGSRVMCAEDSAGAWGLDQSLLARIEFWAHAIWWGMTKDGKKGRNKPEYLVPSRNEKKKRQVGPSLPIDELARRLALPREEVEGAD